MRSVMRRITAGAHPVQGAVADHMSAIASFMQNEVAVIVFGLAGMLLAFLAVVLLGALSFVSAFLYRAPGGLLSFIGVVVMLGTFAFVQLATTSMELQYGPSGPVIENTFYALGGFLSVLGYLRLTLHVLRSPTTESKSVVPGA